MVISKDRTAIYLNIATPSLNFSNDYPYLTVYDPSSILMHKNSPTAFTVQHNQPNTQLLFRSRDLANTICTSRFKCKFCSASLSLSIQQHSTRIYHCTRSPLWVTLNTAVLGNRSFLRLLCSRINNEDKRIRIYQRLTS